MRSFSRQKEETQQWIRKLIDKHNVVVVKLVIAIGKKKSWKKFCESIENTPKIFKLNKILSKTILPAWTT